MVGEIWDRFEAIEECYEFMLAYAAQGLTNEEGSDAGKQVRRFLNRAAEALDGLAASVDQSDKVHAFLAVLDRDARDSLAAVELVLVQPAISSQLIDNLNASVHLRALLTDVFLLGEVLRTKRAAASDTAGALCSADTSLATEAALRLPTERAESSNTDCEVRAC
jgi:hypothetical protein